MLQSDVLVATLKKALKNQGVTYRVVARKLKLSEATVKRLFAENKFTLRRLEQVCDLIDLEIMDLVNIMESERKRVDQLSDEQEQMLVSDPKFLLVGFLVVNRWNVDDISKHYQFEEPELVRYLVRLDRLRLIELLPGNRVRMRISANFSWRPNGPIQRFFSKHLQEEFLANRFDQPGSNLQFLAGMLSRKSIETILRKMKLLAKDFDQCNQQDSSLCLEHRHGYSLMLAMRPWQPDVFEQFKRG